MNGYTGEVFRTLKDAIITTIKDFVRVKACRTFKMFNIVKLNVR